MEATTVPPSVELLRMVMGSWVSQAIHVAAELGIADLLRDGPRSCPDLASATSTHAQSLYRIMRTLASVGIFFEDGDGCFRLTPLAEPLQTDVPGSIRPYATMLGRAWCWGAFGDILHSVKTGESAFEHVYGTQIFDYFGQNPADGAVFDQAMTGRSNLENQAVLSAYSFAGVTRLVDVGGGHGTLLGAILHANPALRGVLFDQPAVVEGAEPGDRCQIVGGSFFEAVPEGGDAYLLKKILHDWGDEPALAILKTCRRAMTATARLLIVEHVIPPGNVPALGKVLDLAMLVLFHGGRERTEREFHDLLARAGFALVRVVPTNGAISVLEAVPA